MIDLRPHGGSPSVDGVRVQGDARHEGATLTLAFALSGAIDRIRLPPPAASCLVDGLWRQTCFEAFVARDRVAAYHELNLSPSSAWAVHAFRAYREGGLLDDPTGAPELRVHRGEHEIRLEATVPLARLDAAYVCARLTVGLAAVVEDAAGVCSYWALAHPSGAPDFHRSAGWTLRLEAPFGACDGEAS